MLGWVGISEQISVQTRSVCIHSLHSCPEPCTNFACRHLHSARPASWLRVVMSTASSRGKEEERGIR